MNIENITLDTELKRPIKIIDIQCWDNELEKFFRGDLVLGFNICKFYTLEGKTFEVNISLQRAFYYDKKLDSYGNFFFSIFNGDEYSTFLMNSIDVQKTENVCKIIEGKMNVIRNNFKIEADQLFQLLVCDESIKSMICNYLNSTPQMILLSQKHLIWLEFLLISSPYGIGELTLLSTFQQRDKRYLENLDIYEQVKNYKSEYLDKLIKIIRKKVESHSDEHIMFVTWQLLYTIAIDFFSDRWKKEYEHYFENINNLDLTQCVGIYCNIDTIEIDNVMNAGIFAYYMMKYNKFDNNSNFLYCINKIIPLIISGIEDKKVESFEKRISIKKEKINYSIDDIDLMNGHEFENFISQMFNKMGYSTTITKASGDQGIDVIAERNGKRFGIQAKCYASSVTNSAIQEVVAGINHYNLDKAIVVTNNYFTKSAQELANSNSVTLWDRNMLKQKILEVFE